MIGLMKDELGGKIMTEIAKKCARVQKSVQFLKALPLMTTRPACLMVKRYIESKCCLRTRNTGCTRSTSII